MFSEKPVVTFPLAVNQKTVDIIIILCLNRQIRGKGGIEEEEEKYQKYISNRNGNV